MAFRLSVMVIKILLASLVAGVAMSFFEITPEQIASEFGLSPEKILEMSRSAATWAFPHIMLGAMVIVPVWIILYLFKPPRS